MLRMLELREKNMASMPVGLLLALAAFLPGCLSSGPPFCALCDNGGAPPMDSIEMIAACADPGASIDKLLFASYGTPTGVCPSFAVGACNAANSSAIVAAACVGSSACVVYPNTTTFGDKHGLHMDSAASDGDDDEPVLATPPRATAHRPRAAAGMGSSGEDDRAEPVPRARTAPVLGAGAAMESIDEDAAAGVPPSIARVRGGGAGAGAQAQARRACSKEAAQPWGKGTQRSGQP